MFFETEDEAAQFIAQIKTSDPTDALTYVIKPDPANPDRFIIEIFAPDKSFLGRV